jgi:acetyl-CoA carboxylase carboxyl transferase subunit alpha
MLQYSTYSVISPEGCASILWKSADKASQAAEAMGITAERLHSLGLVDDVISEPLGGAHRDHDQMAASLKRNLLENIEALESVSIDKLLDQRYQKLMSFGNFKEA